MNFASPLALLWMAAALPVVALYFLKMRRRKVPVSSTWLWARSIQDLRVNAPFQRLRKNLLLLLQILLVAIGALALAEPVGRKTPPEGKRWVLLVDRSASMRMKDVAPSRLERAREHAREILRGIGSRDEAMVIAFSNRAQVMTPFTPSRRAAEDAVDRTEPSDGATRIAEAFRIAVSAVQPFKSREIVILSDGRFEPLEGVPDGVDVRFVPVGGTPRNAAVTAIDVKKPARAGEPWTVFAQIDLFHAQDLEVPVELLVNGELRAIKKVRIPANTGAAVIFEVEKPEPEVVQVRLGLGDDLETDDRAWHVVRPGRSRVLLVGPGKLFLETALELAPEVEAFRADDFSKVSPGEYEVVVLDGAAPESLPEGKYLILGAIPKWEGVKVEGELKEPGVVDWDRRHPVARGINFSGIYVKSSPKVELPGFAAPIVEGGDGPLIFSWEKGRTRAVVATFDLLQSDWPLRLSFPLFLANALEWLRDEGKAHPKPGEPLRIRLSEGETEVEVATPSGRRVKLTGEGGRDVVLGETDACGVYTIVRKSGTQAVAINLLDPLESSGQVAKELRTGTGQVAVAGAPLAPPRPFWRWFALAALALLLVEWTVYHRRLEI